MGERPDLNNNEEEWYLRASVARPDGTYSYVMKINDGSSTVFNPDTYTGSVSIFYRNEDRGTPSSAAQTTYLPGEHVAFSLLRPKDTVTDPAWAYYADEGNINYNGQNNTAIEGKYTLFIEENRAAGSTALKLVEGPQASVSFAAHQGSSTNSAIEAPADLNNPGVGKYFVYAKLYAPDGVKRRTGFYVAELPNAADSSRTTY